MRFRGKVVDKVMGIPPPNRTVGMLAITAGIAMTHAPGFNAEGVCASANMSGWSIH